MSLAEILPVVRQLPRPDQEELVRLLAEELLLSEKLGIKAGQSLPVWSPFDAYEAAATLANLLEVEKTRR